METVQQNGRFTLFFSKFLSIYSILYGFRPASGFLLVNNLNVLYGFKSDSGFLLVNKINVLFGFKSDSGLLYL